MFKWFEQNPIEPVFVGLSDSQFKKVARHLANEWDSDDYIGYEASLRRALDEQTFLYTAKPAFYNNEGKVYELDGSVTDYKADYESVAGSFVSLEEEYSKLKAQEFQPNWDDAPEWATKCRVRVHWADDDNHSATGALLREEQRPKPSPKVDVGQVWDFHGSSVEIVMVTKFQIVMKSIETGYLSIDDGIDDFLAKFEQVQS